MREALICTVPVDFALAGFKLQWESTWGPCIWQAATLHPPELARLL